LPVVSVVCCQIVVTAADWSLVQRSPTDCGASCVIKKPRKREGKSPLPGCENTTSMGYKARKTNNKRSNVNEIVGACRTHWNGQKCVRLFDRKTWRESCRDKRSRWCQNNIKTTVMAEGRLQLWTLMNTVWNIVT
jgi:hypothetical protein